MILFILIAFFIAKIKKYSLSCVFRTFSLYPLFALELLYWFFQINTFLGNYDYVKYAVLLRQSYMLVLLVPVLLYRLFTPALVSSGVVLLGTALNRIAMNANDGRMPVFPTLSRLTGYYQEGSLQISGDSLHVLGDAQTKLKILTDYIDVGWSVLSIGDLLNHSFVAIIVFYTIKAMNDKKPILKCKEKGKCNE